MTNTKLNVEKLFDGESIRFDQSITVVDGKITDISNAVKGNQILPGTLVPGYIDIQVNGGGGFLFNQSPTVETIKKIGKAHQQFGTTGWLPTLITDSYEKMIMAADAVAEALKNNVPGVLGIHFEGPFLSKQKKGVHSESFIRKIGDEELTILKRRDLGKVLVTLAPETVSPDQIRELVESGVIVSLGHSNATFEQTNQAINAGATGFTHLFNAMSPFESRKPGMVGAALLAKNCFSGIILDGVHVHQDSANLAYQMNKNLMLVTDAMPPVGSNENSFEFFGGKITRNGLKLTDTEGRLAGSALDMHTAVTNAEKMLKIEQYEAINLASRNPAKFLGIERQYGKLCIGFFASMLLISDNGKVVANWVNGKNIFNDLNKNN
ncbi:MAG: N-acetylglucosamine-6-phosphate deacetylase [Kangiella sp.]|nr:MAG: N-acetylglucosamine-6-phosphate deacetylase [Kangiella sp.]